MWRSVIATALRDIARGGKLRKKAIIWILSDEDYMEVCERARIPPDALKKSIGLALNSREAVCVYHLMRIADMIQREGLVQD